MDMESNQGLAWQVGVWDKISNLYFEEIDRRFAPVVDEVIARADLKPGEQVLDLGTGTGAVALRAASVAGHVTGVDISTQMLLCARRAATDLGVVNVRFLEGRGEAIPADDSTFDAVLASLSLMYVIDRAMAASELARVLRPGGRLIAAAWAGPEECDVVKFQQTAGSFAPPPPVDGVGPGALADPAPFLKQLAQANVQAHVERRVLGFEFDNLESAWGALAGVTTAELAPEIQQEAKEAVRTTMWNEPDQARHFRNSTQFITGRRVNGRRTSFD